ncbi:PREDICTED: uncharacterized protein LOC104822153 isoform X2 [Tarenaya hassleriana]|nr:PREDICTED: uncharacterized protein LOC104822153 isoform X2 [Tarenaya hassleriana]
MRNAKEELSSIKCTAERERNNVERDQEKELQAWRDNPSWTDQPPKVKVKTQKGSFCHLNIEVTVGLPPDTVFDIFTHPDNKRYFRNIKENISRKILINEESRQVVEVEQAAAWNFLWWSGTFPVHLLVDENRKDFSSKYKQGKTMFMKVFEGCWRVEPLYVDEHLCGKEKPKTREEYRRCSGGRGRIGSKVIMDQIFQPSALLTPPPLSWYLRGITVKTTESMIEDLMSVSARVRSGGSFSHSGHYHPLPDDSDSSFNNNSDGVGLNIKESWRLSRSRKRRRKRSSVLFR